MKKTSLLFAINILMFSGLFAQTEQKMTTEQYIEKYKEIAIAEMLRSRIPASITLAQGILESGSGNSRLAIQANNHFGIKCKKGWTGDTIHEDDDAPQECFRSYKTAEESYRDHSDFLMNSVRYSFLFDLAPDNFQDWAYGLKKAGYATNPNYPQLLIGFIEKHNLHQYDLQKPGEQKQEEIKKEKEVFVQQHQIPALKEFNGIPVVRAKKGDSYAKIALENDMMVWQIYKYNDIKRGNEPKEGDTLYLKPKFNKGTVAVYEVQFGDNMYRISQRFAIKLKTLYKLNQMEMGTEPMWSETLNLQSHRKTAPRLRTRQDEMFRPMLIPVLPPPAPPVEMPPAEVKKVFPVETKADSVIREVKKDTVAAKPVIDIPKNVTELPADTIRVQEEIKAEVPALPAETVQADTFTSDTTTSYLTEEQIYVSEQPKENIEATAKQIEQLPIEHRADSNVNNSEETFLHTVQPKETLYSISHKYNLKVADLKELNKLVSDTISIGMPLIVNQHQLPTVRNQLIKTGVHVVAEKETLYGIAKKYNLTVDELIALNQLQNLNVRVGQELVILQNAKRNEMPEENKVQEPVFHIVTAKETLYSISRKYNVTIDELMSLNGLKDFTLSIGQQLRIE
ncbi:MAG: LysM peptidoglycan-binding domain-containing protein [Bacteroidia bacterium]|nr:LysM peptidoglycan-binding domain-containing protein [Bacteroidia bacterium]